MDAALDPDPVYRPPPAELREVLSDAEGGLSDEGGLVEPETLERFGLTAVRARTRLRTLVNRAPVRGFDGEEEPHGLAARLAPRAAAGLAAGVLVLVGLEGLGPTPPFSTGAVAAASAVLVALLPRVGWILSALFVCGWLGTPEADQPGTALVLAAALAPTPLLLPRAGLLWSVPALAPLMGAIALAPLFVGVAALASTAWRRAGLAAAGFIWLAVCEVLTDEQLLFGAADGTAPRPGWEGSLVDAAGDALYPLVSSPALAPAIVWAAFAAALPLFVRGRWPAMDLLAGALWAAGLVFAHEALGDMLAATTELESARGAVAGAALAGLVAVAVTAIAPPVRDGPGGPALP